MLRAGTLLLAVALCPGAGRGEQPMRVTTDSSAYCTELTQRFAAQATTMPASAVALAEEGQRLCQGGHVRTGIAKLRRALRVQQAGG
ncbi:hypothetical protein DFH01_17790 [Falsiroseomonas bella]|uniref:Uncharacterized protein n=1 Tax=Falsiroseomonas bella TaxID=2184016 RepID=A0A317F8T5_9PROT|nr:hypothetical protein [Falsiroseomonas bella]PWS35464.1 hypothetical protein DFH01_17790 [Falsiroseomonas bella]